VPTLPPPEHSRWKPGQSGNPAGSSQRQRITGRLLKIIEEKGLDDTLAVTWLGAALGDEKLLKGRKPNFAFFKELLDRVEGKAPDGGPFQADDEELPKRIIIPKIDERHTPPEG
jgi:hypothetical protein